MAADLDATGRRKMLAFQPSEETLGQLGVDAPQGTVILSHGLGDTAMGWADAAMMLAPKLPDVRFVLPTAPTVPVTLNGGMPMPAWYDLSTLDGDRSKETCPGLDENVAFIESLVADEVAAGIPRGRIVLMGFSQGGALSLSAALRATGGAEEALAGCAVLSGYLPVPGKIPEGLSGAAAGTPLAFFHGDADPVVRPAWGQDALGHAVRRGFRPVDEGTKSVAAEASTMSGTAEVKADGEAKGEAAGVSPGSGTGTGTVQFKWYKGLQHSANEEELADVARFLRGCLGAKSLVTPGKEGDKGKKEEGEGVEKAAESS